MTTVLNTNGANGYGLAIMKDESQFTAVSGLNTADRQQPVLALKCRPPLPGAHEVSRSQLCDEIFAAGGARIVVIRAAAGFGKTTVMRQVYQRCVSSNLPCAWLTLDAADNDVGRFLAALAVALAAAIPALDVGSIESSADSALVELIEHIGSHRQPFLLFLDEFESLVNPAALGLVRQVIDHLPPGAQIVIGSRSIPALGLGRLRAQGKLLDIEPGQLRFSIDEASELLRRQKHLPLSDEQLARLHQRTEGWPAGLSLASLALERGTGDPRLIDDFSGSDAAISDFLAEDVLGRQPEELRGFLLETSVLSEFTPALCNEVCGRDDSRTMIERLERANLFLIPVDRERDIYRYHSLFAEFLRGQLEREQPSRAHAIHLAASYWYERQQRPVRAIEHALQSGDLERAVPLLAKHAAQLLADARMRMLARWFGSIPPAALVAYPQLRLIHAWVLSFVRSPREALTLLDDVEKSNLSSAEFAEYLLGLRPLLLSLMDRPDDAYERGRQNLPLLPQHAAFSRHMLLIALATVSMIRGSFDEAQAYIEEARRTQTAAVAMFSVAVTESIEGAMALMRGRLRDATIRLRAALNPDTRAQSRNVKANAMAGILMAEALYEAGELGQAERLLNIYAPLIKDGGLADQIISGHVLMARIAGIGGDQERHFQLTKELEHLGHRLELPRAVASAKLERARFALSDRNVDVAAAELKAAQDDLLWARVSRSAMAGNDADTLEIGELRYLVRSGRAESAMARLDQALEQAEYLQRRRRVLKLRILLAEAAQATGQKKLAQLHIGQALSLAAPEGFRRTFLDEGPTVLSVVEEWLQRCRDLPEGRALAEFAQGLLGSAPAQPVVPTTTPAPSELLTPKEIEALRLANEGLSNRAISERLFISESTVRTHMRNINTKLDVHSRTQAIAVARRHGLIS
jgi:LuxR family maltose regulon positive regulatory protein